MKTKRIVIVVFIGLLVGGAFWYFFKTAVNEPNQKKVRINELLKDFVTVEEGTFLMGTIDSIGASDEVPHFVTVSTFQIQTTEVTQELYELVMEANPSENKSWKDMPVTNVSWEDCQEFLYQLFVLTGRVYRLPTEAEWEYAAKGGAKSKGYLYAGSNNIDEVGWYAKNSGNSIHVIKEKKPNELGLYDMTGNAWEWCSDWYGAYRTDLKGRILPKGPDNGKHRVLRGGCWNFYAKYCRTVDRHWRDSENWMNCRGFRLVLSAVR
jgi:formylglycine-generating enzyme required for sulfatase activity